MGMRLPSAASSGTLVPRSRLHEALAEGHDDLEYRELFLGGADIALRWLPLHPGCSAWLNDKDPAIAGFWLAVQRYPDELCHLLEAVGEVDKDQFALWTRFPLSFRDAPEQLSRKQLVWLAAGTLILLQYSGGKMKGEFHDRHDIEPIENRPRRSGNTVGCRDRIRTAAAILNSGRVRITCLDYKELLRGRALRYLDPPYSDYGQDLYRFSFTEDDHRELARLLRRKDTWVLSYDNSALIRELYPWEEYHVEPYVVPSTAYKRHKRWDLLITP
jgi:DNA adenine methylase